MSCFGPESCPSSTDDNTSNETASSSKCGGEDCYALSFGIPAVLMMLSLLVFLSGSQSYIKHKPPGGRNIFFMFTGCIWVRVCHQGISRRQIYWSRFELKYSVY